MTIRRTAMVAAVLLAAVLDAQTTGGPARETAEQRDVRMAWWREARFGMFIHWGLYAIPAGEWKTNKGHGEWIRQTAQIPVDEYERFVAQFNPVNFDADAWVRLAKDAGMQYMVITSKHHDGFCLFDSQYTDYDIMSTPFKRDILKELSGACQRAGIRLCFYHSIMDWHHPDYLPRREWETRPAEGADFERYIAYMKNQLRELCTNYGPIGVLWFDGEWESTWTHERGVDLYHYVRGLRPDIIINNRVDVMREGMAGFSRDPRAVGDFGTPEQEIPATGIPGADWETCMTMNDHWGFNRADTNFKSTRQLVQMLADIASKGGNFLLNVGPTAEGEIPAQSVERLREIGRWMSVNGESIRGTQASPFKSLDWGRCTSKPIDGGTRLYLHVFDWPQDGRLVVPGLLNDARQAGLLRSGSPQPLDVRREGDALVIALPRQAPDAIDSVIALDVTGKPDVSDPPAIWAAQDIFVDALEVTIASERENVELRYTFDGSDPTAASPKAAGPVRLTGSATVKARAFRGTAAVSGVSEASYRKVTPRAASRVGSRKQGLEYEYYEGDWDKLPDFDQLTPVSRGTVPDFTFAPRKQVERFAFRYRGYVSVPRTGVYRLYTSSDDGSRLYIGEQLVVDNDGLHGMSTASGAMALEAGQHPITVTFFEKTGGDALEVLYEGPGIDRQRVPAAALSRESAAAEGGSAAAPTVTPDARQLEWQALEFHAFVHFGMNTFTNREWGDGRESPAVFNPTQLDARQWVRAFKAAGMKQVVLSCKHHDGFCLWPSRYTEHSVKSSPWRDGRGDLVREVSDACREAGLKFGVYLSPWDRHEPSYGDSPRYNAHFKNQLTELLTQYGPVHEVWFDGACGEGPNGKRQEYDWPGFIEVVRTHAPAAVIFSDAGPDIRWVGNESGFAGETNWSTLRRDEFYPGTPNYRVLTEGHEDGTYWVPAECDVSIRPGWFYHPAEDDKVKTLPQLLDIYYGSVGRNGVLLLNVPPDRRGLVHENDAARLAELRAALDETFRENLARGKTVTVPAGVRGPLGVAGDPAAIADGDATTALELTGGPETWVIQIDLGAPVVVDRVMLQEDIRRGQRVRWFAVEAAEGAGWRTIAEGTTIGFKRLFRIPVVESSRVRLVVRDARGAPVISEIGLFRSSPREALH